MHYIIFAKIWHAFSPGGLSEFATAGTGMRKSASGIWTNHVPSPPRCGCLVAEMAPLSYRSSTRHTKHRAQCEQRERHEEKNHNNAMQCSNWTARRWRLWKRQIESTKQIEILFSPLNTAPFLNLSPALIRGLEHLYLARQTRCKYK